MQLRLQIVLGNDAMRDGEDVAAALEKVAANIRDHFESNDIMIPTHPESIMDANGARVGGWKFEETA
jgi:hypothetical protein